MGIKVVNINSNIFATTGATNQPKYVKQKKEKMSSQITELRQFTWLQYNQIRCLQTATTVPTYL